MPAMIIVDEIMSADGVAARTDGSIDFFIEREGLVDSVGDAERMSRVRAILLGAQTYREFSAYWPTQEPTLDVNRLPKHVLSRAIEHASWGDGEFPPAIVEQGDAADVALELEERYGGDIIVWGSLTVARALLSAAAVDEVWLRVVPVAVGGGRTFWPQQDVEFRSVETKAHPGGWTTMRCQLERRR
jgi:dihydrofolate reductase